MRFKITRVYVVEAGSKAEALETLRAAEAAGAEFDYLDVEFVRPVLEKDGGWMQAVKDQLL